VYATVPKIDTGISGINQLVNGSLPPASPAFVSTNPLQIWLFIGSIIWLLGIALMLAYSLVSLRKLRKGLHNAVNSGGNIYLSDRVDTAFVLGLLRPKIYLPTTLSQREAEYILLHEQTHIKRCDHIIKVISFLLLCVHWFNPLVWLAFILMSKDMEMACDEAVIQQLGSGVKQDYSSSLLSLTSRRRMASATPLAFGEGDTKGRIRHVLGYQSPAFWVLALTTLILICVSVGLMTNPKEAASPKTGPAGLWESRTQYVGDHVAVSSIVGGLNFPEGLRYQGLELLTSSEPYGIKVSFETDTQSRNLHTDAEHQVTFQQNTVLLFSLIENAGQITFTVDDGQSPYSIDYTRPWAEALMGGGDLFARSETLAAFEELEKEASRTLVRIGEEGIPSPSYSQSLTAEELKKTETIARNYFTNEAPYYKGVDYMSLAPDDYSLYQNKGIESEYAAGNIIIYMVLTYHDKEAGNPERSISIARRDADAAWEIINQGF
jgi:beta-lactamase regulating signal transducer with metallopeptidase domain